MNESRENRFCKSIDSIEPKAGAKERMWENIKCKAKISADQEQKPLESSKKIVSPFNKFMKMALPIAACFVIAVIGIVKIMPLINNTPSNPGGDVQIPSPFVTVDSAKDFEKLGIELEAPSEAEDVAYSILDGKVADISFLLEGHFYNVRASKQSGDFSGLQGDRIDSIQIDSETNATIETLRSGDEIFYKISWTNGEINFILINTDAADADKITAVYQSIK